MVVCMERDADLHMAQLPLTVSCFSKIQIGFTLLVPAHPGSPEKRAGVCVCVCCCSCGFQRLQYTDVVRYKLATIFKSSTSVAGIKAGMSLLLGGR